MVKVHTESRYKYEFGVILRQIYFNSTRFMKPCLVLLDLDFRSKNLDI